MLSCLVALVTGETAHAQVHEADVVDLWSEPNPGVRYLRRTTSLPCTIHALVVDLRVEGVSVVATPHDERWRSVSAWARDREMAAAVNGGFWGSFARSDGIAAGGGEQWPDVEDDADHGFFAVGDDGRAWISPPEDVLSEIADSRLAEAVSGRPMLVRDGEVDAFGLDLFEHARNRHPRTAVGVSRDGAMVYLVVADGRRAHSRGLNLYELSELMAELGAHDALNLDGGGSSTLYVERLGGVVNAPSGGRWEAAFGLSPDDEVARERVGRDGVEEHYVRGVEREVMNHLGVLAPRPLVTNESSSINLDALPLVDTAPTAPPRSPIFRLGAAREAIYPALWIASLLIPLLLAITLLRRRLRRP